MSKTRKITGNIIKWLGFILISFQILTIATGQLASLSILFLDPDIDSLKASFYVIGQLVIILFGYYLVLIGRSVLKKETHGVWYFLGIGVWVLFIAAVLLLFNLQ